MANINSAYITYKTQLVKRKTNKSTTFQQIQWVKGTSGLVALQTRVQFEASKNIRVPTKAILMRQEYNLRHRIGKTHNYSKA